ncbi:MAG: GIY-YIG nuclease family protein [Candidatus Omnitrophota bacterium]
MYVYILRSKKDGSFYVGSSKNVQERLMYHNKGYSLSTKSKAPWDLVRIEEYKNSTLALKRERYLKSGQGRRVIMNLCAK